LEATSSSLLLVAARMLGACEEEVVHNFGYASGLARFFLATPKLYSAGRQPILDCSENALRAQATFYEGQQRKTSLETKIGDVFGLRAEVDNVLGSMARFGRQALEAKLKSYYSAQLGEPIVNVEEGRIGLERAGRFYEGLALSGAERDLLATAIDCAFKDLQGTPKVILLEADTIDPDNLKMTLDRLKERAEAGDITQVVLATWYDVSQVDSSVTIVKL